MHPDITAVRHIWDYQLELTFSDGVSGVVDFKSWVVGQGSVFAPLEEKEYFATVSVNDDLGTIVWPNDVDFDPEVLYSRVTGNAIPGALRETSGAHGR